MYNLIVLFLRQSARKHERAPRRASAVLAPFAGLSWTQGPPEAYAPRVARAVSGCRKDAAFI